MSLTLDTCTAQDLKEELINRVMTDATVCDKYEPKYAVHLLAAEMGHMRDM